MDLSKFHNIYFLGIGGIGMSALARYFNNLGKSVSGYDKTSTPLTDSLTSEGINIHFTDEIQNIPKEVKEHIDQSLIIYTPAIPKGHCEFDYLEKSGYIIKKRSQILGDISNSQTCLAIAGTHGKTTTTSIVAHIFNNSSTGCHAFVGGVMSNYNSNFISGKKESPVIVEADEYDRSFLTLNPDYAVITSMDPDHLDIYGEGESLIESFKLFANKVDKEGTIIIHKSIANSIDKENSQTYSSTEIADYYVENLDISSGFQRFTLIHPNGVISDICFGLPGKHNLDNAIAAIALALLNNIDEIDIKNALKNYSGVKRRFEKIIDQKGLVFIDDYAHHPEELKAIISSVKELYPDNKITGIFQPHLYSRTRDFADEFAKSLELLDNIILIPIYPAREKPIEGIDSQLIFNKISKGSKKLLEKNELLDELKLNRPEILITLGAGDIDQTIQAIKATLLK